MSRRSRLLRAATSLHGCVLLGIASAPLSLGCGNALDTGAYLGAEVQSLTAFADCDAGSEGDFYISLGVSGIEFGPEPELDVLTPIDVIEDVLVQTESSPTPVPIDGIAVVGSVPDDEQATLRIVVEIFENDLGGPQVTEQSVVDLTWYPELDCWASPYFERPVCITEPSVEYELTLEDGAACDVRLDWRILVE